VVDTRTVLSWGLSFFSGE